MTPSTSSVPVTSASSEPPITPPAGTSAAPVAPTGAATGPAATKDDAIAHALPAANAALSKSYAASKTSALGGKEPSPWVRASEAIVEGDAKKGWTVRWTSFPPAGFGYEAVVTVSGAGAVKVTKANAQFSPD